MVSAEPTGRWVLHYYTFMQTKRLPRELEDYQPMLVNALMGRPGEDQPHYMQAALDKQAAWERAQAARKQARRGWTEYHQPRLTGNATTDEWERAILEGREPDW